MAALIDLSGRHFGDLLVVRREGRIGEKVAWLCRCNCGGASVVTSSDLVHHGTRSCGCAKRNNQNAKKEKPGYHAAHYRVRKARGRPAERPCADCAGPAQEWSYDHSDPDELTDSYGPPYSLDPNHYEPRCVSCHRVFDTERVRN